jgi:hypothetical protein
MRRARSFAAWVGCVPRVAAWWMLAVTSQGALAWGPEGHSIVAEIAQRRLTPAASAAVARVLGPGVSLASISSWADDMRPSRPQTYNWHFVNIPLAADAYDAALHCKPSPRGDCIVAELERLRNDLRCAADARSRSEALHFAVHFVGDIHQPFHAVAEARGGNETEVATYIRGATCTGSCKPTATVTNLHRVWDSALVEKAAWNWGALANRIEQDLPRYAEDALRSTRPAEWASETHGVGRSMSALTPDNRVLDEQYYERVLPIVLQQLGRAGVRLAQFLDDAYASDACPVR